MSGERDYPSRKPLRLPAFDYSSAGYYFVTVCTHVRGRGILCPPSCGSVGGGLCAAPPAACLTDVGRAVYAAIRSIPAYNPGWDVDLYCIMPDHIHLIAALAAGRDGARPLPDVIGRMKSYTDRQYRALGAAFGPTLWQRGYYDHVIRCQADLDETRRYIANNPLKERDTDG